VTRRGRCCEDGRSVTSRRKQSCREIAVASKRSEMALQIVGNTVSWGKEAKGEEQ
jgi:hypothetical protein